MLGFIMSKMQMLIFATGVAVIGLLFLSFISGIELKTISQNTIITAEKIVVDRLSSDNLCSSNSLTFPDVLYYGIGGNTPFFYDIIFSKVDLGNYNSLVISISEHGKKTVLGSRSIPMKANIVLVDPGFILGENSLNPFYDKNQIVLYPRAAYSGKQAAPPNSFITLKEVIDGETTLYVVPCSSLLKGTEETGLTNNCTSNLLLVGCHKLKLNNPTSNDLVQDCFSLAITTETGSLVRNINWEKCKSLFPGIEGA